MDDSRSVWTTGKRERNGPLNPAARVQLVPATARAADATTRKPKLLDQVRDAIRTRHMSPRTEEA
jgi:hypothetical protein